ncbi:hypothetical protein SAMN02910353_02075 [Ruminococcus sp. YRD2003]|uniref:hypothetical protein n=1 Tax=Ruminococcus sp. YRD2003 TaxID=1452313 RepID=UPI0008BE320F|nr:hypothetical protein SAMN02910353_02075 [Ruminococcus flavefaciens]
MGNVSSRIMGQLFGASPQTVNYILKKYLGVLDGEEGNYTPSEEGREHANFSYGNNGSAFISWDNDVQESFKELVENNPEIISQAKEELREYRRQKKQEEEENDPYKYLLEGNNDENNSEDDDYEIEISSSTDVVKYGLIAVAVGCSVWYIGKCIKKKRIFNPFSKKNKKE